MPPGIEARSMKVSMVMKATRTLQGKPSDPESQRDSYWLLACVLDIRNFTELTARVDEISRAPHLERATREGILEAYRDYVQNTQDVVKEAVSSLTKELGKDYAIKPTGDGLLVSIALQDVRLGAGDDSLALDRAQAHDVLNKAIKAVSVVVRRSYTPTQVDSNDTGSRIYHFTKQFLESHGRMLGYSKDDLTIHRRFCLTAGCAFGLGTFITSEDSTFGVQSYFAGRLDQKLQRQLKSTKPLRHVDANGHAVNLAFRLCDASTREVERAARDRERHEGAGADMSPPILLQRQLFHFMFSSHNNWKEPDGWKAKEWRLRHALKGIEDSWCYGLEIDE
jgi:hypothetical protein